MAKKSNKTSVGLPGKIVSDPQFAAIELTAEATDKLSELFADLKGKLDQVISASNETKQNVIVLKAGQDEIIREQGIQSERLSKVEDTIKQIDRKVDAVQTSIEAIRQAVGGATSLAKSALDVANKTRLKKVSANGG